MGAARLKSVTVLGNNGVAVVYAATDSIKTRFVPAGGTLSVPEAARLLGCTHMKLPRMIAARRLRTVKRRGRRWLRVKDVLRLGREQRGRR